VRVASNSSSLKKSVASRIDKLHTSASDNREPSRNLGCVVVTFTARACGFNRRPRHALHGEVLMYFSICRRYMGFLALR